LISKRVETVKMHIGGLWKYDVEQEVRNFARKPLDIAGQNNFHIYMRG